MFKSITRWITAFQAGMIAHSCKFGCVADDETETITPCIFHARRINELQRRNEESW